ncbi:unnamed protein product, partial [Iphiclides podalirius]
MCDHVKRLLLSFGDNNRLGAAVASALSAPQLTSYNFRLPRSVSPQRARARWSATPTGYVGPAPLKGPFTGGQTSTDKARPASVAIILNASRHSR